MKIPATWNKLFANVFYDKTINVLVRSDSYDDEGGLITTADTIARTINCNVKFKNLDVIQQIIGLRYEIDMAITMATTESIALNSLIGYENRKYLVSDVIPYDSHILVVCKIWKSS